MQRLFVLAALATIWGSQTGLGSEDEVQLPSREKVHVYLLIGQSNMAGRGKADPDAEPPERVVKLDKKGRWVPATDPLHFDKPRIAGVGPGSSFGPAMAEAHPGVTIALVPCAVGGTPLSRWVEGGDLYKNAVRRAKIALKSGALKGILWHQGEAETRDEQRAKTYAKRLTGMVGALRKDLDAPDVPFVAGELGRFLSETKYPFAKTVNEQIQAATEQVLHAAWVSSKELTAKSDGVHFDAAGARELGKRYAKAMRELQAKDAK